MNRLKTILFYLKANLIWLFKYRCRIPDNVIVSRQRIEANTPVYFVNRRLHIVKPAKANEYPLKVDGLFDSHGGIVTKGTWRDVSIGSNDIYFGRE